MRYIEPTSDFVAQTMLGKGIPVYSGSLRQVGYGFRSMLKYGLMGVRAVPLLFEAKSILQSGLGKGIPRYQSVGYDMKRVSSKTRGRGSSLRQSGYGFGTMFKYGLMALKAVPRILTSGHRRRTPRNQSTKARGKHYSKRVKRLSA